ncbi:hypothetical protein OROGR_025909 [Orobanche gracilis]
MAAFGRRDGLIIATQVMKTLSRSSNSRSLSGIVHSEVTNSHTQKWMQMFLEILHTKGKCAVVLLDFVPYSKKNSFTTAVMFVGLDMCRYNTNDIYAHQVITPKITLLWKMLE